VSVDPRVRSRVLQQGHEELRRLQGPIFDFEAFGSPVPDRFRFKFTLKSVLRVNGDRPVYTNAGHIHILEFKAPASYPESITNDDIRFVTTPIFHPNVFRDGRICVGGFVPSESLGRFALRMGRMIKFDRAYINENSAANSDAATWYKRHLSEFPVDPVALPSLDRFISGARQKTFIPGSVKR